MKKRTGGLTLIILSAVLFISVVVWLWVSLAKTQNASSEREISSLKSSVENAVTMCYSIEGAYPESLDYLTENYGVVYDSSKFILHYECVAANIRPTVTVIERNAE